MATDIEIPLTKGYRTVISAEDAALAGLRWYAEIDKAGNVYAVRKEYVPGRQTRLRRRLHREVSGAAAGQ